MRPILINCAFLLALIYLAIAVYGNFLLISKTAHVEIDEETGCQYMVNRNGGITPRIGADYMHLGCNGIQGEDDAL